MDQQVRPGHDLPAARRAARGAAAAHLSVGQGRHVHLLRRRRRWRLRRVSVIPTDGRKHDPNKQETTYLGDTVGHWEGDTLVLDARMFNDFTWLGRGGFFHSDEMRVIERFTRQGDVLLYDVTVEDPEVLAEPYVFPTRVVRRNPNPDAGLVRERGNCEVYETDDITSQIRH